MSKKHFSFSPSSPLTHSIYTTKVFCYCVYFIYFFQAALRQITDKARDFGAGPLFNQILPLLMSPTLEDQERHLLVKVIDRILYKLDDLVRPYVHKILVVIEPLLIDEDYYARVEGREIISNLAKVCFFIFIFPSLTSLSAFLFPLHFS